MPRKRNRKSTREDPENPFLTEADFRNARPAREVLPELFGKAMARRLLRPRGRPLSIEPRVSISLRLPPDVLDKWKASGPGWQTRMVKVLSKVR
jgi:uncharacterized protein (DUF4415 family)